MLEGEYVLEGRVITVKSVFNNCWNINNTLYMPEPPLYPAPPFHHVNAPTWHVNVRGTNIRLRAAGSAFWRRRWTSLRADTKFRIKLNCTCCFQRRQAKNWTKQTRNHANNVVCVYVLFKFLDIHDRYTQQNADAFSFAYRQLPPPHSTHSISFIRPLTLRQSQHHIHSSFY